MVRCIEMDAIAAYRVLSDVVVPNTQLSLHWHTVEAPTALVGLDVGARKVGVATYNRAANLTLPLKTIQLSKKLISGVASICEITSERSADAIVVGLPLGADLNVANLALEQIKNLVLLIKSIMPQINIALYDERFTTAMANRILKENIKTRAKRHAVDDEIAAAILLDNFVKRYVPMRT